MVEGVRQVMVDDIAAGTERLRAAGVTIAGAPRLIVTVGRSERRA